MSPTQEIGRRNPADCNDKLVIFVPSSSRNTITEPGAVDAEDWGGMEIRNDAFGPSSGYAHKIARSLEFGKRGSGACH